MTPPDKSFGAQLTLSESVVYNDQDKLEEHSWEERLHYLGLYVTQDEDD